MKFDELVRNRLEKIMADESDAELAAILHGTIKLYETNYKIINTKLTKIAPMLASEAYTMVNELAENIYEDMDDGKTNDEAATN